MRVRNVGVSVAIVGAVLVAPAIAPASASAVASVKIPSPAKLGFPGKWKAAKSTCYIAKKCSAREWEYVSANPQSLRYLRAQVAGFKRTSSAARAFRSECKDDSTFYPGNDVPGSLHITKSKSHGVTAWVIRMQGISGSDAHRYYAVATKEKRLVRVQYISFDGPIPKKVGTAGLLKLARKLVQSNSGKVPINR